MELKLNYDVIVYLKHSEMFFWTRPYTYRLPFQLVSQTKQKRRRDAKSLPPDFKLNNTYIYVYTFVNDKCNQNGFSIKFFILLCIVQRFLRLEITEKDKKVLNRTK